MPDAHSLAPASAAARFLECTPSLMLEKQFPNTSSEYAKEGTVAHSLGEIIAKYKLNQIITKAYEELKCELIRSEDGQKFYCKEMEDHATEYADLILDHLEKARENCPDAFAELEVKSDYSEWIPGGWGTSDCVIISDDTLEIIDLKYGKGHRVDPEGNPQLRLYALGAYQKYKALFDIEYVRMTIYQPRLGHVASDTILLSELLNWAEQYVKPRAALALKGEGEFNPNEETCRFCKAKGQCRARANKNLSLFDQAPDLPLISIDEAGAILSKAGDIKKWLEDLESVVTGSLLNGKAVEGWKLVAGKSNRTIKDDIKAVELLKAAGVDEVLLYNKKLITLTEMEKNFGKKFVAETLAECIVKPEGKPTLAPASDKRDALNIQEAVIKAFDE